MSVSVELSAAPIKANVKKYSSARLEKRLLKLKELGTFGISLSGGDAPYS
jgi:hypothetical protein